MSEEWTQTNLKKDYNKQNSGMWQNIYVNKRYNSKYFKYEMKDKFFKSNNQLNKQDNEY